MTVRARPSRRVAGGRLVNSPGAAARADGAGPAALLVLPDTSASFAESGDFDLSVPRGRGADLRLLADTREHQGDVVFTALAEGLGDGLARAVQ